MKYKLLVLDIDGTLTNNKKEITKATKVALIKAQEKGVNLVLASGRPTFAIRPLAKELEMDHFGGFILSYNGGQIIDCKSNRRLYERDLNINQIKPIYDAIKEEGLEFLTFKNNVIITENKSNKYVKHEEFLTKMNLLEVPSFTDAIDFKPKKILIAGNPDDIITAEEKINTLFKEEIDCYKSEPFYLEIVPKNVDKAKSLEALLQEIKVMQSEMIAVGDGFNDLSMIEFAGLGIAMANAQEPIKACSDYVTLSNEEDGIVHLIDKFIFSSSFSPETIDMINEGCKNSLISNLGITFTYAAEDYIEATMPVNEKTSQPFGILHGGASLAMAETIAGVGTRLLLRDGEFGVGMQVSGNHVSSAVNGDIVKGIGKIIHKGRSSHVWNIDIYTSTGKLVSSSRVINSILKKR